MHREAVVSSSTAGIVDERGMTFTVRIAAHEAWETTVKAVFWTRNTEGRDIREAASVFDAPGVVELGQGARRMAYVGTHPQLRLGGAGAGVPAQSDRPGGAAVRGQPPW
ncbi:hypothetical protein O7608_02755 [Solwaraspora sp. WMMA2056]|uniref:hypothetical protein n=1 Tax=Solwaraspora sp. WMMA2056 TaxID=3015161 RepID=UPI00259B4333|nr:hypothetical protein [Solwaraspora sp. WMMA2056]WJK41373.1 hypothetical protein O7608_02755 [Solwaraspora sp. WMMA2056]